MVLIKPVHSDTHSDAGSDYKWLQHISSNIQHNTIKQRGMAADEEENELIEDLIKFREKHLESNIQNFVYEIQRKLPKM